MPREKFKTLTEPMFYILICLQDEYYGSDIMEQVKLMTDGRVRIGPGTLYHLLDDFVKERLIEETRKDGRKRCYRITITGQIALEKEVSRLRTLTTDYTNYVTHKGDIL